MKEMFGNLGSFNVTDAEGKIVMIAGIPLFKIMLAVIFVLILLVFVMTKVKTLAKLICFGVVLVTCLIMFKPADSQQLTDVTAKIKEQGLKTYEQYAKISENVKIEGDTMKVKLGNQWFDLSDIESMVDSANDYATVMVGGKAFTSDDKELIELLKCFVG